MSEKESVAVTIARIDENVKHIVGKIEDHEKRIRDNERFKNRGYGALGILSAILGIVSVIVGWIVIS